MIQIFDKVRIKENGKLAKVLDIVPIYGGFEKPRYLVELIDWPEGATLKDIIFDYALEEIEKVED